MEPALCLYDCVQLVAFRLRVMVLVEEGYGNNAGE